jgi:hypothetical protein
MTITRQYLLLTLLLGATACTHQAKLDEHQATMLCEGDRRIHLVFTPNRAVLESQGVSVAMEQKPTADGYLYAGGGQSVRGRGTEATWTDDKGRARQCKEAPQ